MYNSNYSFPLNNKGLGLPTLWAVKNLCLTYGGPSLYTFPSSASAVPHPCIQSVVNFAVVFTIEKKKQQQQPYIIVPIVDQSCVVQKSVAYDILEKAKQRRWF